MKFLFANVWVHFGIPTSIISGRDSRFLRKFWSCLWELMETKLKKRTIFHLETDGQIEVVDMIVVHLLGGYFKKNSRLWDE
jgi:hypothetical protein